MLAKVCRLSHGFARRVACTQVNPQSKPDSHVTNLLGGRSRPELHEALRENQEKPDLNSIARSVGQQALTGDVIDFEPGPVGIFEQHRVVTRRPVTLFGWMYDLRAGSKQKLVN